MLIQIPLPKGPLDIGEPVTVLSAWRSLLVSRSEVRQQLKLTSIIDVGDSEVISKPWISKRIFSQIQQSVIYTPALDIGEPVFVTRPLITIPTVSNKQISIRINPIIEVGDSDLVFSPIAQIVAKFLRKQPIITPFPHSEIISVLLENLPFIQPDRKFIRKIQGWESRDWNNLFIPILRLLARYDPTIFTLSRQDTVLLTIARQDNLIPVLSSEDDTMES